MKHSNFALLVLLFLNGTALPQQAPEREFALILKDHKFDKAVLEVKEGEKFSITVVNSDKSFEEFESKSLNFEKFMKPGAKVTVYLGPLKAGEYDYFAEFHASTGRGKLIVKP